MGWIDGRLGGYAGGSMEMDRWTYGRMDGKQCLCFHLSSFPKMVDSVYPRCYGLMDAQAFLALHILAEKNPAALCSAVAAGPPDDGLTTTGRFSKASFPRSVDLNELPPAGHSLPFCGECTVVRFFQDGRHNP